MIARRLLGVGISLVLLASVLLVLASYIFTQPIIVEASRRADEDASIYYVSDLSQPLIDIDDEDAAPLYVTDLNQVIDVDDIKLEVGIDQSIFVVKIETSEGSVVPLSFILKSDISTNHEVDFQYKVSLSGISGIYEPFDSSLLIYGLSDEASELLSTPGNCRVPASLVVSNPSPPAEVRQINGYDAKWELYDFANQELEILLHLPIHNSTTNVSDDCFVIKLSFKAEPIPNWPMFTITGQLTPNGCQGLLVTGRGGDDLEARPTSWVCREDLENLDSTVENILAYIDPDKAPAFDGPHLAFIETRSDVCGSRLLVSRPDLEAGKPAIRAQWQDWHDNCAEGQFDKDEDRQRLFDLTIANGSTNPDIVGDDSTPLPGDPGTLGSGSVESSCEFNLSGIGFGYIICWILNGLSGVLNFVETNIRGYLKVGPEDYQQPVGNFSEFTYKNAWRNVRDFSTYAIVGTALFMVISTALDLGLFKNYTVKKYLPRLIIGAIVTQFSWALGDLFIQTFNHIGDILEALLFSSFPGITEEGDGDWGLEDILGSGWQSLATGTAVTAGLTYVGWATLLPVLWTLSMFFLLGFFFLVARKFIIILLLIFTPLGIALWVLPGNDKAWNLYFKTFFYLLVMYPIIIVLISAGKIFSYLILL